MNFDIGIDSLTGLVNLFGLIKSNSDTILGSCGTVLFLDLIQIKRVNDNYGSTVGDKYFTNLVDLIDIHLDQNGFLGPSFAIGKYRYGGNFILVFKDTPGIELSQFASHINSELNYRMNLLGAGGTGIYFGTWSYYEVFSSIPSFLKHCQLKMQKFYTGIEAPPDIPEWADFLIERLFNNFYEAISEIQRAYTIAHKDDVSELANYKAAQLNLNVIFNEHKNSEKSFSILFIDGDNLKRYNELSYQHGNDMIRQLAHGISESIRKDDVVFRWLSGDEFIVLLKDTNKYAAYKLAERIRIHIEEITRTFVYPVTISVGVASYPEDGNDIDSILRTSEQANAKAKKSGKNCVV